MWYTSGYDVAFDMDNTRIGFAESDCQMPGGSKVHGATEGVKRRSFGIQEGAVTTLSDTSQLK